MKLKLRLSAPLSLALLAFLLPFAAVSAETVPDLFDANEPLAVELVGPVWSVLQDREERNEQRFRLLQGGVEQDVWIRVRGNSRSRKSTCQFPPLRFRFEAPVGAFAGQQKLKLVTHCRNSELGDADVMEEYAAYRIFNLLSPVSLRVRPLRLDYSDTDDRLGRNARQHYGFLIEPVQQLAARTGGELVALDGVALAWLDPDQAALVYVFQYLIGNTDWSLIRGEGAEQCCHNGRLLKIDGRIHYVPYDFDLSGLVNARYATPDPSLNLRNVRQRRYRGFCTDTDTLRNAVRAVVGQEQAIYDVVRSTPGLDARRQQKAMAYLGDFFEMASDESELLAQFDKRCLDN
jgi:hypothetical protein